MGKDPAFLFYPNDYIGGTMGMTFEEKGAYMEVLMMQFNRGHMTTHMIGQTIGQLWDTVKVKFIQDDKGLWYNERLEQEQMKRQEFTKSRRNNVSGVNQYTKTSKKELGHMTEHMENENRDRDRDKVKDRELIFKSEVQKFNSPHEYEFLEYWTEQNKSGTKMRFEMERTWDLKRRLSRWASNNFGKKERSSPKKKQSANVERIMNVDYDNPKFKSNRTK